MLKTFGGFLRSDASVAQRCILIDAEKSSNPVAWTYRILRVPLSKSCDWQVGLRVVSETEERREAFGIAVRACSTSSAKFSAAVESTPNSAPVVSIARSDSSRI